MAYREDSDSDLPSMNMMKGIAAAVVSVFLILAVIVALFKMFESVNANEILVVQSPRTGDMACYATPGIKYQGFGKLYWLPKRITYDFEKHGETDSRVKVRFAEGGHGFIEGSQQIDLPTDCTNLQKLVSAFGTAESIQKNLIERTVAKAIYFTGPLMTSKESYAEKKNAFFEYVEDQISAGVYTTVQTQTEITDDVTGQVKKINMLQIVEKNGQKQRQESGQLTAYGLKPGPLSIKDIDYDDAVDKQIKQQQDVAMAVQLSIAEAKQAEQKALTVEQQGRASAAEAKWSQEKEKAKAVVIAEQSRDVNKLQAEAAKYYNEEQKLRADADATYKRQVMSADGALKQKLDALIEITKIQWDGISRYQGQWTPVINSGSNTAGNGGFSAVNDFINLMNARNAKELGLDFRVAGREGN